MDKFDLNKLRDSTLQYPDTCGRICRNRLRRHAIIPVKKAQSLGKIVHRQNATKESLACTTSFEERKQRGDVNN